MNDSLGPLLGVFTTENRTSAETGPPRLVAAVLYQLRRTADCLMSRWRTVRSEFVFFMYYDLLTC